MFCPLCKAEYREGFTRCDACDVELVDALPSNVEESIPQAPADSEVVWSGYETETATDQLRTLEEAGITAYPQLARDEYADDPASGRSGASLIASALALGTYVPKLEIRVARGDLVAAQEALRMEEAEPQPIPEEPFDPTADESTPTDLSEEETEELCSQLAWSGDSERAEELAICLRENGIPFRIAGDSPVAIFVRSEELQAARDIVRQVVEQMPPE